MVMTRTVPDMIVEAAMGVDPNTTPAAPDWIRLDEDYCPRKAQRLRGQQQRLESPEPGTLVLRLDDPFGDLDPENTLSPFFGDWDLGTRVRVRLDLGAEGVQNYFLGWVEDVDYDWNLTDGWVDVTLVDRLAFTAQLDQPVSLHDHWIRNFPVPATHYWPMHELGTRAGVPLEDVAGTAHGVWFGEPETTDAIARYSQRDALDLKAASFALLPNVQLFPAAGGAMSISFWFRMPRHPGDGSIKTVLATRSDGFGLSISVASDRKLFVLDVGPPSASVISLANVDDDLPHHCCVTYEAGRYRIFLDGVDNSGAFIVQADNHLACSSGFVGTNAGLGATAAWPGSLSHLAIWPMRLSASQVNDLYLTGNSAWRGQTLAVRLQLMAWLVSGVALADIIPGTDATVMGPVHFEEGQTMFDHLAQIARTGRGLVFAYPGGALSYIPPVENPAALPTRDYETVPVDDPRRAWPAAADCKAARPRRNHDRLINRAEITPSSTTLKQSADNLPSQAKYGIQRKEISTFHDSAAQAKAAAAAIVALEGDARSIMEWVTVDACEVPLAAALPVLGEVVRVTTHPPGRMVFYVGWIVRVEDEIDYSADSWDVTIGLLNLRSTHFASP